MTDSRLLPDEKWNEIAAKAISDQPQEYRENCIAWLRWDREARIEANEELGRAVMLGADVHVADVDTLRQVQKIGRDEYVESLEAERDRRD